ncbi:MAG: succinyl-diaminopimelate desuccinylase [Alphaproteobacteria bacterium]|nr:succinyl-diaminopimelate desuccinylase [Alphaproteobacteria bacterium]OJV45185.1 MAG: succinyl-diaminopimelate desuccinylase [Alphaproteobacteria bacterium 43-37]
MDLNVVVLLQALIQIVTITPDGSKALDYVQGYFVDDHPFIHREVFHEPDTVPVDNLFLRIGTGGPHFCFAGHVDVVPEGDIKHWHVDPFAGAIKDGAVIGRGASDMKGSIAAFMRAARRYIDKYGSQNCSISFLLTSDEEGPAINGTRKMLGWMMANDQVPDVCIVGEPTSHSKLGDTFKIGRRGSVNFLLKVLGTAGHVAYPKLAENPIPTLAQAIEHLNSQVLDDGTADFDPSHLEFSSICCPNKSTNVIPSEASAQFNIRFNVLHTLTSLEEWVRKQLLQILEPREFELTTLSKASPFIVQNSDLIRLVQESITSVTGRDAHPSTTGGTSDARFIHTVCPVVEFGLLNTTIHKPNEAVAIKDLEMLEEIYYKMLINFFQPDADHHETPENIS